MSELPLTTKYAPVDIDQARKFGFETAEWQAITEAYGRAPDLFECQLLLLSRSDEISPRSGEMFLRSIYRRNPTVIMERAGRVGIVDIGFGEALYLGIDSATRAAVRDTKYGIHGAGSGLHSEMTSLGATVLGAAIACAPGDAENARAHRLLQHAVAGSSAATNATGVPLTQESVYFHPRYDALGVFDVAFCGIGSSAVAIDYEKLGREYSLLYIGPKTVALSPALRSPSRIVPSDSSGLLAIAQILSQAVQDKSILALERISSGGIAIATFQLASRLKVGLRLDLDTIPIYVGPAGYQPTPEEALLSDSPGRYLALVSADHIRELNEQCARAGFQALKLGEPLRDKVIELVSQHRLVAAMPLMLISNLSTEKSYELLMYPPMLYRKSEVKAETVTTRRGGPDHGGQVEFDDRFLDFLANPNLCSRDDILQRFDRGGGHSLLLGGRTDAAVYRIERQIKPSTSSEVEPKSTRGLAFTMKCSPLYGAVDPYLSGVHSASSAMRAIAASGALPVAAAQSLSYGDPKQYKQLAEFSEGSRGLSDACRAWQIPIIAERVMFQSGATTGAILPTPTISLVGVVSDISVVRPNHFVERDDVILLIGSTQEELSTSEYRSYFSGSIELPAPEIDFSIERRTCELVVELLVQNLLQSAHSVGVGGVAVSLAYCCLTRPKPIGAKLTLAIADGISPEAQLFGESSGRFILSCTAENVTRVKSIIQEYHTTICGEGRIGGKEIAIDGSARSAVPLSSASHIWNGGLGHVLRAA